MLVSGEQVADPDLKEDQSKGVNVREVVILSRATKLLLRGHVERSAYPCGVEIRLYS